MKSKEASPDFPYGKPEWLDVICAICGGTRGMHNNMNQRCPKDINASRDHPEYRDTVFSYIQNDKYQRLFNWLHDKNFIALQSEMQEVIDIVHQDFPASPCDAEKYRELLQEIDKALNFVDDTNDKELLIWYVDLIKTIRREIKSLLATEKEDGWIDVNGTKPEGVTSFKTMSDYVQVWIEGTRPYESGIGHGRYCHDRKQWFVSLVNHYTPENPIVTHFRPLPSPPTQEKETNKMM